MKGLFGIIGLWGVLCIPFVSRPFFFDDPVVALSAKAAANHPLHPYDYAMDLRYPGEAMWPRGGRPANTHPPLSAWVLGGVGCLWGWDAPEQPFHVVMMVVSAMGLFFLARLALSFNIPASIAVGAAAFSPIFFLSSLTLYPHVFYWVAYVATLFYAWNNLKRPSVQGAFGIGFGLSAAALSLHQWPLLVFLLIVLYACRGRSRAAWATLTGGLFLFLLVYGGWMMWERHVYGAPQFWNSFQVRTASAATPSWAFVLPLLFWGGGWPLAALGLAALYRSSKITLGAISVLSAVLGFVFASSAGGFPTLQGIQVGLFFGIGAAFAAAVLFEAVNGDETDRLLALWFGIEFVFVQYFLTYTAGHHLLPVLSPAVLLAARWCYRKGWPLWLAPIFLSLMAALSFVLAQGDAQAARVAPRAAQELRLEGRRFIWGNEFSGTLYYFKKMGWRAFDIRDGQSGDWLVMPMRMNVQGALPPEWLERLKPAGFKRYYISSPWRTFSIPDSAGWYSSSWGAFPYTWSRAPVEDFRLFQIQAPKRIPKKSMPTSATDPTRP